MKTAGDRPGADCHSASAARLRTAFDLWSAGVELQRQRFRRMYPDAPAEEIARLVTGWLQDRPGARRGDGPQPVSE